MKTVIPILALLFLSFPIHSEEEIFENVGPEKAVTAASDQFGFQLSPAALRRLGIESATLPPSAPFFVPDSAIVYFQDEVGVYRLRDGWFHLVRIKVLKSDATASRIASSELKPGDAVAVRGAGFLRVTDMALFGEHGGGHGH